MDATLYTASCPYDDDKATKIKIKAALAHVHNVIGCVGCKRMSLIVTVDDAKHTFELSAVE